MLCLGFLCTLFILHVFNLRSKNYRSRTTQEKIQICYDTIHLFVPTLYLIYSPHHVLKHLAVLNPQHPATLLWIVPETLGFNCILAAHIFTHDYIAIVLACTTPLYYAQAFVTIYMWKYNLNAPTRDNIFDRSWFHKRGKTLAGTAPWCVYLQPILYSVFRRKRS